MPTLAVGMFRRQTLDKSNVGRVVPDLRGLIRQLTRHYRTTGLRPMAELGEADGPQVTMPDADDKIGVQ